MKKKREIPASVQSENTRRAVFLPSEITLETFEQLAPEIIRLRLQSADPICVFIHCLGGVPFVAEQILRLIRSPRQDGQSCMVTTVCIGVAASAAADFLSAGDYAIAYNDSLIHFHGTREKHNELTVDNLPQVEASLRQENEYFAMKLANRMFRRFATKALLLEVFKTNPPSPNVIAVGAEPSQMLAQISASVAQNHRGLVASAVDRAERIRKLVEYVKVSNVLDPKADPITSDAHLLKLIVEFEANDLLDRKAKGASIVGLISNDITLIQEDFFYVKELLSGSYHQQSVDLSHQKGHYFLSLEEVKEFRNIPETEIISRHKYLEEKATPKIFPLWYLVVSLCRLLQKGENEFTANDAWHFGLIDEVIGSDLPSVRKWRELRNIPAVNLLSSPPVSSTVTLPPS